MVFLIWFYLKFENLESHELEYSLTPLRTMNSSTFYYPIDFFRKYLKAGPGTGLVK